MSTSSLAVRVMVSCQCFPVSEETTAPLVAHLREKKNQISWGALEVGSAYARGSDFFRIPCYTDSYGLDSLLWSFINSSPYKSLQPLYSPTISQTEMQFWLSCYSHCLPLLCISVRASLLPSALSAFAFKVTGLLWALWLSSLVFPCFCPSYSSGLLSWAM